jgi:hypothetical protein
MSATAAVTPTNWNQIAVDYVSPKTAGADINFRPTESGTDTVAIDPDAGSIKTNILTTFSGSEISFDNKRIGDVAVPTANDNAVPVSYLQQGKWQYAITAGTAPNYTLTLDVPAAAISVDGCQVRIKIHSALTSGTATLNVNGLGAVNIQTLQGTALPLGSFQVGGLYTLQYVSSLTAWVMTEACWSVTESTWTPTMTGSGGMTISGITVYSARLYQDIKGMNIHLSLDFDVGGTLTDICYITNLPVAGYSTQVAGTMSPAVWGGAGYHNGVVTIYGTTVELRKMDGAFSSSNPKFYHGTGWYRLP